MCGMTGRRKLFCEFIYCGCGCQKTRSKRNTQGRKAKYIQGHQARLRTGPKHHNYKGGSIHGKRYIVVRDKNHPFSDKQGRIHQHRLVMEKHIGRYLTPDEVVHHINENPKDNRIENLKLMTRPEHQSFHTKKDMSGRICSVCKSTKTFINKGKYEVWYYTKDRKGFLCRNCFRKLKRQQVFESK